LLAPAFTADALIVAAVAWALAFTLYLWRFGPWLLASRLDGKDVRDAALGLFYKPIAA
jgi:uncharacterized protein involved in response to NO